MLYLILYCLVLFKWWCDRNKPNLKCINKPKPTSRPNH